MKKTKTWRDMAREYVPKATDEEIDFILWEYTCYPFGSEEDVRNQLKNLYPSLKERFIKWLLKTF